MLKIRLSRTGKKSQPSFRVIVQEHSAPIKGRFVDQIGYYRPTEDPKVFSVNKDKIKQWLSVGAQPSDTVASLLKKDGVEGMDNFLAPRDKKKKKKKVVEEKSVAPTPAPAEEAPVEEAAAKVEEAPAPAEEAPAE